MLRTKIIFCQVLSLTFAVLGHVGPTGPLWASSKCTSNSLDKHITLHLPAECCQNRTIRDRVMTSYPFQDGGQGIAILLPVSVSWFRLSGKVKIYLHTKFWRDISIHGWDITTENKCPPFWNSTSGSNIYVCATIGMSFCICLPNFVQILSLIHIWRCRRIERCRSRWSPYH